MEPRPAEASRWSGWLGRVLLAAVSTTASVLALLACEGIARLREPDYLVRSRGLHVFSDEYGWVARRGVATTVDGRRVSLNRHGFRGRELALPREEGRTRLLVLGDSIAYGLEVSDEETFSSRIDARGDGLEVANLAVQGYGPDQELLVLQAEAPRYAPDAVMLAFCVSNDFADAMLPVSLYDGRTPKPRFALVGGELVLDRSSLRMSPARRAHLWLSDSSHLFNRVASFAGRESPAPSDWRGLKRSALGDPPLALRLCNALVRRMDAICRGRDVPFFVAVFPSRASYVSGTWLATGIVESLRQDRVAVVDVAARFRDLGLSADDVLLDNIGHLSPRGHEAAADVVRAELARLPARPAAQRQVVPPLSTKRR